MRQILLAVLALASLQAACALKPELLRRLLFDEPNSHLHALGKISDAEATLERTFLSRAHREAASTIQQLMADAGLQAQVDAVANVRGKIASRQPHAPVLLSGSHYDTVKDAGKYDGMLGVIVPIAALKALLTQAAVSAAKLDEDELLKEEHISLPKHLTEDEIAQLLNAPVELLAFCDEEGIRFQTTFLGSRAVAGDLINSGILDAPDSDGITVRQSLGLHPDRDSDLAALAYLPEKVKGYVEVHMEQGPILEAKGMPLGVVAGIAGQTRLMVMVSGTQGHAGTVPMDMRRDPMATAAEIIHWVEQRCGGGRVSTAASNVDPDDSLMCTTGNINLWPNAFNVIPGSANFTLDIRSRSDDFWQTVTSEIKAKIEEVCARRGIECVVQQRTAVPAVRSDDTLLDGLKDAILSSQKDLGDALPQRGGCATLDHPSSDSSEDQTCPSPETASSQPEETLLAEYEPLNLISGAGHDALAMAKLTRMAMMFVRCRGGHSHSPMEFVSEADVGAATAALYKFFEKQLL